MINHLDLTSDFTDLTFEGFIEISQNAGEVIYRFPEFTIGFLPRSEDVVTRIDLDAFSTLVAGEPPETSTRLLVPISLVVDIEHPRHVLSNIEFHVPINTVLASEYIAFAVRGTAMVELVGEAWAGVPDDGRRVTARAIWPISAKGNRWIENPDARRPQTRYKTPTDPNDPCAPERIR